MGLLTKTGTFTNPTVTGNFDVTGLGFTPRGLIIYQEQGPDTTAMGANMGFADDLMNQVSYATLATGRDAASASRRSSTNRVISRQGPDGALQVVGQLTSMLADGFRINFSTAAAGLAWRYIAFKDVPVRVGTLAPGTAATFSGTVSGMSFDPSAMIGAWLPTTATAASSEGFGMVDQYLNQFSSVGNNNNATGSRYASEAAFVSIHSVTAAAGRLNITGYTGDGFTYSGTSDGNSFTYAYMAIGFVQAKLIDATAVSAPGGGGPVSYTGVGFKPQTLLDQVVVINPAAPTSPYTDVWGVADSFGVSDDALTQAYRSTVGMNGAANTKSRVLNTAKAFGRSAFGTPSATESISAAVTSYDPDGFTLNWTKNDGANLVWKTLALAHMTNEESRLQTGNARILRVESRTQSAISRIERSESRLQTGNARITVSSTRTTAGDARIVAADATRTIDGISRIEKSVLQTMAANARLAIAYDRDQSAAAWIIEATRQFQYGDARISTTPSRTIAGQANVLKVHPQDQPADAAVLRRPEIAQPAAALVANEATKIITGGAYIIRVNDYTTKPRVGVLPQKAGSFMQHPRPHTSARLSSSHTATSPSRPRMGIIRNKPRGIQ